MGGINVLLLFSDSAELPSAELPWLQWSGAHTALHVIHTNGALLVCVCVCVSLPLTQPLLREQAGKTWGSLQRPILSNAFYCSDDAASCGRCSHLSWKLHEAARACVYDSDATIWHILTLQRKVPLAVEFGLHGNKLVVMHIGKGKNAKEKKVAKVSLLPATLRFRRSWKPSRWDSL